MRSRRVIPKAHILPSYSEDGSTKGFCKAVMAVAHKLALLIHWVVVNQKPYIDKEFDYTGVFKQDGQRRPRWIRALRRYGLMTLADVEKEKAARGWIIAKA